MGKADTKSAHRNNKTICLPFSQEVYNADIYNACVHPQYFDRNYLIEENA
jgi:hypothetical protein